MSLDDQELSSLLRANATRHRADESLRASIRTQIALADAGRAPPKRRWAWRWPLNWRPVSMGWGSASLGFAGGLMAALLALPLLTPVMRPLDIGGSLESELVADHVRALNVGPLFEVASSDRHTVKPWFQGRLDYSPPVFDLATEGFPLVGGRIEHVRGNRVAALSYSHNRHVIDVFVWPTEGTQAPQRTMSRGFNVVRWADGAMQVWAVSDTDRAEIERFQRAWTEHAAAQ